MSDYQEGMLSLSDFFLIRRVGYMPSQHSTQPAIPESVSSLFEKFDVVESLPNAPSWDFVWNAIVEEGREKGMLSLPFTTQLDVLPLEESSAEDMCLAEAAVKVIHRFGPQLVQTPHCVALDGVGNAQRGVRTWGRYSVAQQCGRRRCSYRSTKPTRTRRSFETRSRSSKIAAWKIAEDFGNV